MGKNKLDDLTGKVFGKLTVCSRGANRHGNVYWTCRCECGTEKDVAGSALRRGASKSCGCLAREMSVARNSVCGEKHPAWKGGTKYTRDGYVILHLGGGVYIPQHRQVMEEHLRRKLFPDENVHHINGIRSDNRIENLELWCKPQPSGVRARELYQWACDIVERYKNENL